MAQQGPPAGQAPTYKSNVNRAKTKKWVEAKSYSYDGDDWGDVDDYDEYGGYDEPPPPPQLSSRATGLRQRGQSASHPADQYGGPPNQQAPYGDLGQSQPQNQHGTQRSFTQPQQPPGMNRQNSFDPDEERRAFSGGSTQPSGQRPTTGPYSTPMSQGQPVAAPAFTSGPPQMNRIGPAYQGPPPSSMPNRRSTDNQASYSEQTPIPAGPYRGSPSPQRPGQPNVDNRSQSMASNNSSVDFHNRRDFSPSAMPPPLQTRGSPSPNSADQRRPPRTSSLGQDNAPPLPFNPATATPAELASPARPQRDRASSSQSNKSLPFVRPADIYRRMEEEKERERKSQESARPSMEAVTGRPKADNKRESDFGSRSQQYSSLDPVKERRESEFGLQSTAPTAGTSARTEDQTAPTEKIPTTSKRFEIKKSTTTEAQSDAPSLGPLLPDVSRMSGFGDSFGDSFMGSNGGLGDFSSTSAQESAPSRNLVDQQPNSQTVAPTQPQATGGTDLQHTPSLGFTSAVHQSFDTAQDQVPPTPSSMGDSSIERSASGGTSIVSPIISRGPSTATEPWSINLPTIEDVASPVQQQEVQPASQRPVSVARKPSPSIITMQQPLESTPPPSFIPGHRRDMSTPSPDNSPARTPAVEANRQLRLPQEVELAETTPTPTESDSSFDDHRSNVEQYPTPDQLALSEGRGRVATDQPISTGESVLTKTPVSSTKEFTRERPDSSGSTKVQNLADKFGGSGSRPQSSHSNTTPRASMLGTSVPRNDDTMPPRLMNERTESFRPHLPGGWESSASVVSAAGFESQGTPARFQHESSDASSADPQIPMADNISANADKEAPSTITQVKDVSQDAFAAAATAGTALAASLAAATGLGSKEEEDEGSVEDWEKNSDDLEEPSRDRGSSIKTVLSPAGSMAPLDPRIDKASSGAPTPLPRDTPKALETRRPESEYFPGPSTDRAGPTESPNIPAAENSQRNSHSLPPISTDLRPQTPQFESDRLRRELHKELAPNAASEPSTAESESPYPTSSKYSATNQSAGPNSGHEIGDLPREHGNYWNEGDSEEDGMSAFSGEPGQVQDAKTTQPHQGSAAVVGTAAALGGAALVGQSLHHAGPREQALAETEQPSQSSEEKPHMLPHRFSWEAPLQELGPQPAQEPVQAFEPASVQHPQSGPTSDFLRSAVYPEGHGLDPRSATSADAPKRLSDQSSTVAETSTLGLNNSVRSAEGRREVTVDSHDTDRAIDEAKQEKELPSYPSDAPEVAQYANEKQFLDTSLGPGSDRQSNSGPQDELRHSPEALRENNSPLTATNTPVTPSRTVEAPLPPVPAGAQPKIPAFREILALKTPSERIRAYDSTREQFANLNTGLAHWLAATSQSLPEHSDLLSNQGRAATFAPGHRSSPSGSKAGGLLTTGGPSGSGPSSTSPSYAPGLSPGPGGKISSKEVQQKSKELLHTAGVFGGKGLVAGKGLFSKGKSKLRGASGTDKALQFAIPASSPDPVFRGMQNPSATQGFSTRGQNPQSSRSRPLSYVQSAEPQRQPSESTESDRNTPSEQSYSKGQLGDDERSSEDYESAESAPENLDPHPPRSSSLLIDEKNVVDARSQPVPKSTASSSGTAHNITHQTANNRRGTQSPRSTNSSNKTPTQVSFDNSKAVPALPHPLERTESPPDIRSTPTSDPRRYSSAETYGQPIFPPKSRYSYQNLKVEASPTVDAAYEKILEQEASSRDLSMNPQPDHEGAQAAKGLSHIRTDNLLLPPGPEFSPLMTESYTGLSVSPDLSRDLHNRVISIGSIPSALDPERPPSPVSPFVPPQDEPLEQQRGRPAIPVHHGIDHDFVDESSVERARRRSSSFSRPFQTGRTADDSRPSIGPDLQDHPAFRQNSQSGNIARHVDYQPGQASSREPSRPRTREQAPEYQSSNQGAPDLPPVETKLQSRRGSRSSAYLKAMRDSVSPSRRSQTRERSQARERSQPPLPDSSRASDSPHSAVQISDSREGEEKPRRASVFGRTKTGNNNNNNRSDQAQSGANVVPRAATMPVQQPPQTDIRIERPVVVAANNSPASSKLGAGGRFSSKLQRASTSVTPPKPPVEQETGKKKRFSAIGSLFSRSQRRQSSDQSNSSSPQQYQQYGKYSGRPSRPTQRFPLDEDPDEAPKAAEGQYTPHRIHPPPQRAEPPVQPQTQAQRDLPAYMQDRMLRTGPILQQQAPPRAEPTVRPSPEIFNPSPQPSPFPSPQPTPNLQHQGSPVDTRPSPATRSTSAWARFSQTGRSKSGNRQSQPPAPHPQPISSFSHLNSIIKSPHSPNGSHPPQQSRIEGKSTVPANLIQPPQKSWMENERPGRSGSPSPPPPPPKDDRWNKSTGPSNRPPQSTHNRSGSEPLQARSLPAAAARNTMIEQRPFLPPLQTNVPSSHVRAARLDHQTSGSSKENMTPEEKRKSRQEEIEQGHLSATTPSNSAAKGKMSVLQEDEGTVAGTANAKDDEPIVMSATSFPSDMWQPDYLAWEGE